MLIIIAIALVGYPLLGFLLVWLTRNYPTVRKGIIGVLASISILTLIAYLTDVSTVSNRIDGIIVSLTYLLITILLWHYIYKILFKKKWLNVLMGISVFVVITIPLLPFVVLNMLATENRRVYPSDDLIVKEYVEGAFTTDFQGMKMLVYKRSSILSFVESKYRWKEYKGYVSLRDSNSYRYDKETNVLYVYIYSNGILSSTDTLSLN